MTTMGVLVYHFHAAHIAKYTKIKSKMPSQLKNVAETNPQITHRNRKSSHDQHKYFQNCRRFARFFVGVKDSCLIIVDPEH